MSRGGDPGRVYVGDLGSGGSKPELEREFERYGPLKSVWVARNPPGFAFIEFEDPRDADDAVRDMDGRFVCGVRIRVEIAKSNSRPNQRGGGGGGGGGGGTGYNRRGGPPSIVSSRYRNKSPSYRRSRSRSRSRSPHRSPPYRRSPSPRSRLPYRRSSHSPYSRGRSPSPRSRRDRERSPDRY